MTDSQRLDEVAEILGEHGPNLFVVGAMKAGTTSLHRYLDQHESISMSAVKEPNFWLRPHPTNAEVQEYRALFERERQNDGVTWRGEASTSYSKLPRHRGVPERLAGAVPAARIIYIMRDPLVRSVSHYWFNWRKHDEREPIDVALETNSEYADFSYYAMQLRPFIDAFGRDQVYTLTLESLEADPDGTLRELFAWLGLRHEPSIASAVRENVTPEDVLVVRRKSFAHRVLTSLAWRDVGRRAIPAGIRGALKQVLTTPASSDHDAADETTNRALAALRPRQQEQTIELERLLGRSFVTEWTTLYGALPAAD